jgi:bifunctional non-homologous end joining protein LigD
MVQYVRGTTPHPRFIDPMECSRVSKLPEGPDWFYEVKQDGYRIIAVVDGPTVLLYSYSGLDYTERYPGVAFALREARLGRAVLDGELVALEPDGRTSFHELQNARHTKLPIVYFAFDLLHQNGRDLLTLPQEDRRKKLDALAKRFREPLRVNPVFETDRDSFVAQVKRLKLEGVVAKNRSAVYVPGKPSEAWQKQRFGQENEFVIGGYIPGGQNFSELLIGYYEGSRLMFVKRLITGFVPHTRQEVFEAIIGLKTKKCPFANLPEPPRTKHALTAKRMQECVWVKPERQVEVEYVEWTEGGHLRHPKFRRLVG